MKIISHFEGTISFAARWDEIRPIDGMVYHDFTQFMQQHFRFAQVSNSNISAMQGLITPTFQLGASNLNPELPINALDFQPDRVVLVSSVSSYAEEALEEVFNFLCDSCGFRRPLSSRHKTYHSTIIFDPESNLEAAFTSPWGRVIEFIKNSRDEAAKDLVAWGIKFISPSRIATPESNFVLERRSGAPTGENWWFSSGEFSTEFHLKLLEEISNCGAPL
jgi:hypothetical protein